MPNIGLLSSDVIDRAVPQLTQLIEEIKDQYSIDAEDELYGKDFRYYVLFDIWPNLLEAVAPELTQQMVLNNKYYRYLRTIRLYQSKHGYDVGMEQSAFKMLEYEDCDLEAIDFIDRKVIAETGIRDV